MASTFTTNLRVELMADGENEDTWGSKANANVFEMFEDSISDEASISTTGGTYTLTTNNGTADEARSVFLDVSGVLVSNSTVTLPAVNKFYLVRNGTSGAFTVTFKVSGQTGVEITQGDTAVIYCDGTVTFKIAELDSGTGYTVTTYAKTILDDADAATVRTTLGLGSAATLTAGTSANNLVQMTAGAILPAVDGSALTNLPSVAGTPAGAVIDFAGTAAPSGYLACDGSAVSRATYATLFTAISTTWGVGDGSTTFNVPNLNRCTTVGSGGTGTATLGNAVGDTGGAETHTIITAEMPTHTHSLAGLTTNSTGSHSHTLQADSQAATTTVPTGATLAKPGAADIYLNGANLVSMKSNSITSGGAHSHTVSGSATNTGSDGAHNNIQPSAVMLKVIKT